MRSCPPLHLARLGSLLLALAALACGLAGCGLGSGILAGSLSGGGDGNQITLIINLTITGTEQSPATIRFVLVDPESDRASVVLEYREGSGPWLPMALQTGLTDRERADPNLENLATSPSGVAHAKLWDFETNLGAAALLQTISIRARIAGAPLDSSMQVQVVTVPKVGNDPAEAFASVVPTGEVAAVAPVELAVRDSSADPVNVRVEYNAAPGFPQAGWVLATPFGAAQPAQQACAACAPTGAACLEECFGIVGLATSAEGVRTTFVWDVVTDLGSTEREVRLRFTPDDGFTKPGALRTHVTASFFVDNNAAPVASLGEGSFLVDPDRRRGIPVPFTLVDAESDPLLVALQWRRAGEAFPPLPADPLAVQAILSDPAAREAHRIVRELPRASVGRVDPVDALRARLPELAGAGAAQVGRAGGLAGQELAILRASGVPHPIRATWTAPAVLEGPVAALPRGDGRRALVLEGLGGGWRLRELALATGAELAVHAVSAAGAPSALALEPGGDSALVADALAGTWQLWRVALDGSGAAPLMLNGASGAPAPVRGLASLGRDAALLTAGDALARADFADPGAATTAVVAAGFAEPHGLAVDRLREGRVYLAETLAPRAGAPGRVLALGLDALGRSVVAVRAMGLEGAGFPRPRALALEDSGARLLALTDASPGDGVRELRGVALGGEPGAEVFELTGALGDDARSLAGGPDGLRLVALELADDLAVGGGVEQVRAIVEYDPATQVASVQAPFDPPLGAPVAAAGTGRAWRVSTPLQIAFASSPAGAANVLLWDTAEVAGGGEVFLRAVPFDSERGLASQSTAPKDLLASLAVERTELAGSYLSVAAADVDANGLLDVLAGNEGGRLDVFLQTEPGAFPSAPALTVAVGGPVAHVAAADLDGDGRLDLAASNATRVALYLQAPAPEPPGHFALSARLNVPGPIAPADCNGDGALDLIVAQSVFFQQGGGSFAPEPDVTFAASGALVPVDLDADGRLDLVSPREVFLQKAGPNPPGRFPPVPDLTFDGASGVVAADIDADGLPDLVGFGASELRVFLQSAPGALPFAPDRVLAAGGEVRDARAADLDGDGLFDLVFARRSPPPAAGAPAAGALAVAFQRAPGELPDAPDLILDWGMGAFPTSVRAADLDGDGRLDLAAGTETANGFGGPLSLGLQAAPGAFRSAADLALDSPAGAELSSVSAGDLDGNGLDDLVAVAADALAVFLQPTPAQFSAIPDLVLAVPGELRDALAADVSGDGRLDLIAAAAGELHVLRQLPRGGFEDPGAVTPLVPGGVQLALADLDGDDRLDLAAAGVAGWSLRFQRGAGQFPVAPDLAFAEGGTQVAAGDLDGDRRVDVATLAGAQALIYFQLPTGAPGNFPAEPDVRIELAGNASALALADLNGDGRLDLLTGNDGSLSVALQGPPGQFLASVTVGAGASIARALEVRASDFDRDGSLDLAVVSAAATGSSSAVHVFLQTSPGRFAEQPATEIPLVRATGLVAIDLDGDGEVDLVAAEAGLERLSGFFDGHR